MTLAAQVSQLQRPLAFIFIAILLTKTGVSTHEIGVYETILFVATTISMLGMGALVSSLMPVFGSATDQEQKGNIQLVFALIVLVNILIVSCLYVFQPNSIFVITGQNELPFFNLICIYILFHFPAGMFDIVLILYKKARLLFFLSFCNFLALIGAVILSLILGSGIEGILIAWIVYAILKNIWMLMFFYKKGIFETVFINKTLLKAYILFVIPLLVYAIMGGIANNTDSWIINWFTHGDKSIFGIYRYGAREVPFINAFCIGLSNVMILQISTNFEQGIAELKQKSTALMHKVFVIAFILILLSPVLYPIAFSKAFLPSVQIFNIYILLTITRLIFPQTVLHALKDSNAILIIGVLDLLINIVFSLILVQYMGIHGVAWGTVIAYTMEKVMISYYLYYKYNIRVQDYCKLDYFLSYSALLILAFIASQFIYQWFVV
jgi:O-antigen/teichoic acid export membrane protein